MQVVVLSADRDRPDRVIIGMDPSNGRCVNLLPLGEAFRAMNVRNPMVGEVWELQPEVIPNLAPPHTDRAVFREFKQLGVYRGDLGPQILTRAQIAGQGAIPLFERRLERLTAQSLGIVRGNEPRFSLQFWLTDREIEHVVQFKKSYLKIGSVNVRFASNMQIPHFVPRGSLLLFSLSDWWSPDSNDREEACYLRVVAIWSVPVQQTQNQTEIESNDHENDRRRMWSRRHFAKSWIGTSITYLDLRSNIETTITLCDPFDADPRNDMISVESPIGSSCVYKSLGDEFEVEVPSGTRGLRIIGIAHGIAGHESQADQTKSFWRANLRGEDVNYSRMVVFTSEQAASRAAANPPSDRYAVQGPPYQDSVEAINQWAKENGCKQVEVRDEAMEIVSSWIV